MARSRPSRGPSSRKSKAKLHQYVCEVLEPRTLLIANPTPIILYAGDTFQFRAPDDNIGTIFVGGANSGPSGSTEVEIIGAESPKVFGLNTPGQQFTNLVNLPGAIDGTPVNGGIAALGSALDINTNETVFSVYIDRSDSSSFLTAEEITQATPPTLGTSLAFSGAIGAINFAGIGLSNRAGTVPGNSGGMLLGATNGTGFVNPLDNSFPITSGVAAAGNPFPLLPNGGAGTITAGVTVTNDQDFGNFLWGGTVLGTADFTASINEFYAGWIMFGSAYNGGTAFTVGGDANAIISSGPIGTDDATQTGAALLDTGFQLNVAGRLGMVRTGVDFLGGISVTGSTLIPGSAASGFGTSNEVEYRYEDGSTDGFRFGQLGQGAASENDSLSTPQILPVSAAGTTSVSGNLNIYPAVPISDYIDTYGVALLAGQTITVGLTSPTLNSVDVAVYDPDGILIASDYNIADSTFTNQQPFQLTTQKPGLYRFVVAENTNTTFSATGSGTIVFGTTPYTLNISGIGNVSFGGLLANNIIEDSATTGTGFSDSSGDIGAILAVNNVYKSEDGTSVSVLNGNLREVEGTAIGVLNGALFSQGINLAVNGTVGLLEGTTGIVEATTVTPIGGNLQIVSATGNLTFLTVQVDGGIGVIRAANMATNPASTIQVNALDNPNTPAVIDLIDLTGDLGTLASGGPHIITGPGGDCRYIHVGGTVYQDNFFGGGAPQSTTYALGQSATIEDDSGTEVTLAPEAGLIVNPAVTGTYISQPGTLTVTTYGIEGSGGSAIVNVTSTHGVTVTVAGNNPNQSAEIGTITVSGLGTAVIPTPPPPPPPPGTVVGANGGNGTGTSTGNGTTSVGGGGVASGPGFPQPGQPGGAPIKVPTGNGGNPLVAGAALPELSTAAGSGPLDVVLNGNAAADVYSVTGGNLTSIVNDTAGEIVGINVTGIGNLQSNGSIGVPTNTYGEQLNGASIFSSTYPWNQQHYGVTTSTGIITIKAPVLGNINVGADGTVTLTGKVEGAIVVNSSLATANITGMTWAGSGSVALSGIFATKAIGTITSSGNIYGDIVSLVGTQKLQLTNNASLINAQVATWASFSYASPLATGRATNTTATNITAPILDIGSVTASGTGGIIGTLIVGSHIGTVSASGYGLIDDDIDAIANGTVGSIVGAGYGVRFGIVQGGASVGNITAVGNGSTIPVTNYPTYVRQSEGGGMFDPNTGLLFTPLNDLDVALGTSVATPQISGITDSGIIEDLVVRLSRGITTISAYSIRSRTIVVNSITYPLITTFDVANGIGTLQTAGALSDTVVTTGKIGTLNVNGDVTGVTFQIAGSIGTAVFKSNLVAGSTISVTGPNAHIGSITVDGNLDGSIYSTTYIQTVHVLGSITGSITANRIGTVHVHSGLANGGLVVTGPITNLIFDGDGGNTGDTITINGSSTLVKVAGNLAANLNVTGNLGTLQVGGSIVSGSTTTISNVLSLLKIGADLQAGATVSAHIIKRQMIKGQLFGTITIT